MEAKNATTECNKRLQIFRKQPQRAALQAEQSIALFLLHYHQCQATVEAILKVVSVHASTSAYTASGSVLIRTVSGI